MPEKVTYYKFMAKGCKSPFQGNPWNKPRGKRPGKWMPAVKGELVICGRGYHACAEEHLLDWLNAELYEVELRGDIIAGGNKVAAREARLMRRVDTWDERTARLFTCDCAARVLRHFEAKYPDDKRPRRAIATARRYANGKATADELAAAWAAAGDAAVWSAAGDAAWAAARAAAVWAAAGAAAWAAAGAAAGAAAWAAWDAAGDAAGAVWDAARAAERKWQHKRLMKYLRGEVG